MVLRGSVLVGALTLAVLSGAHEVKAQGAFTLSSPSFKDGERLAVKNAGDNKSNPNCVGENVSPALSWANPPAGTKSYALMLFDPEGRPPTGVSHWVAYGIPVSVTGFAEGGSLEADRQVCRRSEHDETASLLRPLHACRSAASLHVHLDCDRS